MVIRDGNIRGKGDLPLSQELSNDEGNLTTMRHNLLKQSYLIKQEINKGELVV
jgi:hypothetical protein